MSNYNLLTLLYDRQIMHAVLPLKQQAAMAEPCNGLLLRLNQFKRKKRLLDS